MDDDVRFEFAPIAKKQTLGDISDAVAKMALEKISDAVAKVEVMQMKYYPKEIYYENRHGVNYIILDYGDSKFEHVIAAQPSVQQTACTCTQPWLPIGGEACETCGGWVEHSRR